MNLQLSGLLYKKLIIESIKEEIKGFKTFTFKEGHGISYKAGQYLTFVLTQNNEEIRRSYSIVSSPHLNEPLTIGVKRVENGAFSRRLIDSAKPGDELLTTGAGGLFTLPGNLQNYRQLFFLAAGSGITPILSLIKTVLHVHTQQVVLIYSTASPEKTAFFEELKELDVKFSDRFHLQVLFSNSPQLSSARLYRELLQQLVVQFSIAHHHQTLYYICGPEAYMRMCTYTLQEEGVSKENIRKEDFVIQKTKPPRAEPPDKNDHTVAVESGGEQYRFKVSYPDTILQSAKKQGIRLPYSCEVGRCGNCVAKCIEGKVWLSYNEVLTEKDLQSGLTLTCVGHPVGGDVRLVI